MVRAIPKRRNAGSGRLGRAFGRGEKRTSAALVKLEAGSDIPLP